MFHWKLKQRHRLLQHVQEKQPLQTPLGVWWIIIVALSHVFDPISVTMATKQAQNLVI
jgi:hypothetical protein